MLFTNFVVQWLIHYPLLNNSDTIRQSLVLPELNVDIVEQALVKSLSEDDGAISRWLLDIFNN